MDILLAALYPSVRYALDISLDADSLPDAVIEATVYGPMAELWVKQQDPDWAARTNDALTHLKNAVVYRTAALIAPAIPAILSETQGPYAYQRASVDWEDRADELDGRAQQELAAILTPGQSVRAYPVMFTVASGTRGK